MRENKKKELEIKQMLPPEGKALVFIMRRQSMAKLIKVTLECNGTYICTTKGKRFIYLILDPGFYTFVSRAKNISNLPLNLEAGNTYFISQKISTGGIMTVTQLELMEETTGRKKLKKCSLIEVDNIQELIPSSYECSQESLTPEPPTSKQIIKYCLIGIVLIIFGVIILISGILDLMSLQR